MNEYDDTIEGKRRKNLIDNQKFLENLKLFNVRDDFKSTVNSVETKDKSKRKAYSRKERIHPTELRRSSRLKTIIRTTINEDLTLSSDTNEISNEEEDDLTLAFTKKIDEDWQPLRRDHLSIEKHQRIVRKMPKPTSNDEVKIFLPNIGLQASKVVSKDKSHQNHSIRKLNVAISSSDEETF